MKPKLNYILRCLFKWLAVFGRVARLEESMSQLQDTIALLGASVLEVKARVEAHEQKDKDTIAQLTELIAQLQVDSADVPAAVAALNGIIGDIQAFDVPADAPVDTPVDPTV